MQGFEGDISFNKMLYPIKIMKITLFVKFNFTEFNREP